jgi:RNA polymerase sigma-70 factor (ECF subfamily)
MDHAQKQRLQQLMVRLASGDRRAFDPVYEALWPVLRRFAERALAGSPDAEDAAQGALVNVFARASEFDPERDALAWALGVAAYECKTVRQKRRRRREQSLPTHDDPALDPTPEELAVSRDLEAAALELLGGLRPEDAATLRALISGERPPGATFRKRLERALVRLRAAWSSRHGLD